MISNINRMRDENGFTLIELLVVVLIIGILAAIAIPAFLSQRQSARDADAKSAATNIYTATLAYFTKNDESFLGLPTTALAPGGAASLGEPGFTLAALGPAGTTANYSTPATQTINNAAADPNNVLIATNGLAAVIACSVPKNGSSGFCIFDDRTLGVVRRTSVKPGTPATAATTIVNIANCARTGTTTDCPPATLQLKW